MFYNNSKLKKKLKIIESIDDQTLKTTFNSLKFIVENNFTKEVKTWIAKIEKLKQELLNSNVEIVIKDYGACSSTLKLTEEEMYSGRILQKTIGEAIKSSISYIKGILLLSLIKEFKPNVCLELGTALGISSLYQAAALEMNNKGNLTTIEGAKSVAEIAIENFKKLGLFRVSCRIGRFQDILELVINEIKPIDFVFIDGHHDKDATLNYFEKIYPSLSDKAILVFDDIRWSKGMKQAWKTLVKDIRIKFTIDLIEFGICIISNSNIKKQRFKLIIKKD